MNAFVHLFLHANVNSFQINLKNAFLHKFLSAWIYRLLKDEGTCSVFNRTIRRRTLWMWNQLVVRRLVSYLITGYMTNGYSWSKILTHDNNEPKI